MRKTALDRAVPAADLFLPLTAPEIHHRQTPLFLMQGRAEAGVTCNRRRYFRSVTQSSMSTSHPLRTQPRSTLAWR
jgi:hypothetical protein